MLRRGFSYVDRDDSGLLFLAWQADPRRGFIPVQRRLVEADALRSFVRHESSALFAMPGGVAGLIGGSAPPIGRPGSGLVCIPLVAATAVPLLSSSALHAVSNSCRFVFSSGERTTGVA